MHPISIQSSLEIIKDRIFIFQAQSSSCIRRTQASFQMQIRTDYIMYKY